MIKCLTKTDSISACDITASQKIITGNYSTHWHEFYEIELIISGRGTYVIDGNCYKIKKGMLFFMTPVNFHELRNSDAKIINVMFSDFACNRNTLFNLTVQNINNAIELSDKDFDVILTLLKELIFSVKNDHRQYAASILDCILYKSEISQRYFNSVSLTHVQSAMLYVQNHFRSKISLTEVASFVGLSCAYISSLFPQETGMTFKNYVNSLRFDYAKKLLIYSDMSVTQVCHESGFEDYANFLRHFKKHFGMTPNNFKKAYSNT